MRLPCFRKRKIIFVFVTLITSTFLFYGTLQLSWYPEQVSFNSLSKRLILVDESLEQSANSIHTQTHSHTDTQSKRELSNQSSTAVANQKIGYADDMTLSVTDHVNVDTVKLLESDKGEEEVNRPVTEPKPSEETKSLDEELLKDAASIKSADKSNSETTYQPSLVDISTIMDWRNFTLKQIDEIYAYNKKTIEETLLKRRDNILSVCKSINDKSFNRPYLFHFSTLGLSWCPTYKAGSTTWKEYLVKRFVHPNLSHPGLEELWKFRLSGSSGRWPGGKKKYRKEGQNTIRFTVVRNPIVRIISYWKMARGCVEFVRVGMHKDIILRRSLPDRTQEWEFKREFDKYFRWCEEQVKGNDLPRTTASIDNPYLNPPHITFPELVNRMQTQRAQLQTNDWEGHWAPASEWCDICTHKLDYVAKLEEEPWELWYLVDTLGLWEDRTQFLSFKNMASSTGKPSSEAEVREFTSQLSPQQIGFLNSFYDNDFRMFEYDKILL